MSRWGFFWSALSYDPARKLWNFSVCNLGDVNRKYYNGFPTNWHHYDATLLIAVIWAGESTDNYHWIKRYCRKLLAKSGVDQSAYMVWSSWADSWACRIKTEQPFFNPSGDSSWIRIWNKVKERIHENIGLMLIRWPIFFQLLDINTYRLVIFAIALQLKTIWIPY